jgi:Phytanoyl-CoA dioxygenase (PhyH)
MTAITDDHLEQWLDRGFVIVEGLLTEAELQAAHSEIRAYMPTAEEMEETPARYRMIREDPFHAREFPFGGAALDAMTFHPELVAFAERALGVPDLYLTQSLVWGKYAGGPTYDQRLHLDYGIHSLVVPRDDDGFRQVSVLLYYSDVTEDLGPTSVVPRTYTRDLPLEPRAYSREQAPELYENEVRVVVPAGSALLYGMLTWHRGTAMRATSGARFSHHIVYRKAEYEWMGHQCWPHAANNPEMADFMHRATPRQRSMIGFPKPGHAYWNAETLAGVAARYPGMDMTPYEEALYAGAASVATSAH